MAQLKKDEEERQECARRVQEKQDRTKAFEEQRQALMRELETTRNEIAVHEAYLKVRPFPERQSQDLPHGWSEMSRALLGACQLLALLVRNCLRCQL